MAPIMLVKVCFSHMHCNFDIPHLWISRNVI